MSDYWWMYLLYTQVEFVLVDKTTITLSEKDLFYSIDQIVTVSRIDLSLSGKIVNAIVTLVPAKVELTLNTFAVSLVNIFYAVISVVEMTFTGRSINFAEGITVDKSTISYSGKDQFQKYLCMVDKANMVLDGKGVVVNIMSTVLIDSTAFALTPKVPDMDVTVHIDRSQLLLLEGKETDDDFQRGLTRLGASMHLE